MNILPTLLGRAFKTSLVALALLALAACSSNKMAYRYADWGIVWWVDDFIPLTGDQRAQLSRDIEEFRQWHCSSELPRYQAWLDSLMLDVSERDLAYRDVELHQQDLFELFPPLLDRVVPIATRLLSSLSEQQVEELARNLRDNQQEYREKYLGDSPVRTVEARAERAEKRIERWFGDLNDEQKTIVRRWAENRGRQTEIWLQGRRNWQEALLAALDRRNDPGFDQEVARLIKQSEQVRGTAYESMMEDGRSALTALLHELIEASGPQHLAHLQQQAASLDGDLEALTCTPSSNVASG
ncbi:DUF3549 domain-containing protein [Marinobacter salinisoli]|uniref:DUF3549 domain-containing protein n=1 Tax=Marinobacter salinisoli TaxID=2769486 RepID=A0ABX7N1U8_9GAMM|nr:DUF6279 family lipoprotein [Marinobacter salinisoli]QSP96348.1 DUF3549 domain-containing protein [Marinobacter salinisoli]